MERTLGERIRHFREQANLSQSALEHATGMKREYLSKIEGNHLPNPTIGTLQKLADGIGVPVEALVTDAPTSVDTQLKVEIVKLKSQRDKAYAAHDELLIALQEFAANHPWIARVGE